MSQHCRGIYHEVQKYLRVDSSVSLRGGRADGVLDDGNPAVAGEEGGAWASASCAGAWMSAEDAEGRGGCL
ncbi:MAG: hypothetical protein ACYS21_06690 [Planctomycetota bacterium]